MARVEADLVRESSTSTGTGSFTVTGAATGEKTFASRCSVGDTFDYCIRAVDGSGVPTGEWEVGEGSYSASNTISRNTVYASSNGDALVNFSAGIKQVSIVFSAKRGSWVIEKLTAARTYYVRTDGSDSNTGLVNSAAGAFLTVQKAIDVAAAINNNGFDITINVVAGTYTAANTLKSFVGHGKIIIQGASLDQTSTVVSVTSADCFSCTNGVRGVYDIQYMKLQTVTSGGAIVLIGPCRINFGNINFGSCVAQHIVVGYGATARSNGPYTVSGGATYHYAVTAGNLTILHAVTCSGTPAFAGAFALAQIGGVIVAPNPTASYSGSATGPRYLSSGVAAIYVNAGGASFFPGSSSGTVNNGGVYY